MRVGGCGVEGIDILYRRSEGEGDDWDVYYERGREPKESIIKYEAARSEGDYRRKVLLARIMRDRGEGRGVRG